MSDSNPATPGNESHVDASLARQGGLSYLEVPTLDADRSAAFYQRVLGWNILTSENGPPKFADRTGHLIGRWVAGRAIASEPGLLAYFYVDRIGEAITQVAPSGGEVIHAPRREGNLLVATVRDPAGNVIGLWQDADKSATRQ